jgi:hypothetical protein
MIERWKATFGFCLIFLIAGIAVTIALGKVEERSSFGLQIILGCLTTISGGFAAWAFGSNKGGNHNNEKK